MKLIAIIAALLGSTVMARAEADFGLQLAVSGIIEHATQCAAGNDLMTINYHLERTTKYIAKAQGKTSALTATGRITSDDVELGKKAFPHISDCLKNAWDHLPVAMRNEFSPEMQEGMKNGTLFSEFFQ